MKTLKLTCAHVDTCLPDYWSGHHLAHISVPVYNGTTPKALRDALHGELNQGAVCGSDDRTCDDSGDIGDAWYKAAHAAINRDIKHKVKGKRNLFPDLEKPPKNGNRDFDDVYAYFVFIDQE